MLEKQAKPHRPHRTPSIPIKLALIVPLVLPIFAAVGLAGYFSIRNAQKSVHDLATQLRSEVSDRLSDRLDTYLSQTQQLNQVNLAAIELGLLDLKDFQTLEKYFWRQMQTSKVGYIHFANSKGEFIGLERTEEGKVLINQVLQKQTQGKLYTYDTDKQGNRTQRLSVKTGYDPRLEAWYTDAIEAKQPIWSQIYQWEYQPELLSISASAPVYNQAGELMGVIGVDGILSQINDFLVQLNVSPSGKIFIVEGNGLLVASSTIETPLTQESDGSQRLHAGESHDPLIRATTRYIAEELGDFESIQGSSMLNFTYQGERQFVQVTPWQDEWGLDWSMVVVLPESNFMAQIQANRHTTILFCLAASMLASGFAIVTARTIAGWIAAPILQLSEASTAIASGKFDRKVDVRGIKELEVLGQSFNGMTEGLKASFKQLEQTNQELETHVEQRTAALKVSEEKFSRAFRSSPVPLAIETLKDARIVEVNDSFCRIFGYTPEEAMGKTTQELNLWNRSAYFAQFSQMLSSTGVTRQQQLEVYAKSGEIRTIELATEIIDIDGQACILYVANDISDRTAVEAALRQSEARFALAVEGSSEGIWDWNLPTNEIYFSPRWKQMLGYQDCELTNEFETWQKLIHPEDASRVMEVLKDYLARQRPTYEVEFRALHKDGNYRWLLARGSALWDQTDQPYRMAGSQTDITDRKVAETFLWESQRTLLSLNTVLLELSRSPALNQGDFLAACRRITEAAAKALEIERASIWLYDRSESVLQCSNQFDRDRDRHGQGGQLTICDYPSYFQAWDQDRTLAIDNVETDARTQDLLEPYLKPLGITSMLDATIRLRGKTVGVMRLETVETLHPWMQEEENFAGSLADLVALAMEVSERVRTEAERDKLGALVENSTEFIGMTTPDGQTIYLNQAGRQLVGLEKESEISTLTLMDFHPSEDLSRQGQMRQRLIEGESWHGETSLRHFQTGEIVPVLCSLFPVKDRQTGATIAFASSMRDLRDRKQAEAKIQASLREKEVLLKEIHHRVKNNLYVISNLLDLQSDGIEDERVLSLFADSQNRIQVMALIHEQLYQSEDLGQVDLGEYIQRLVENLFFSCADRTGNVRPIVRVESVQLNLETAIPCGLLINELVTNSIKHAFPNTHSGEVHVELDRVGQENFHLTIWDNGIGMPPDLDWQKSSSLGLKLVRILAKQLKAQVEFDFSQGTLVRLNFSQLKYKPRF